MPGVVPITVAHGDGSGPAISHAAIARVLQRIGDAVIDFIRSEDLGICDGEPGHALGQGQ